MKYAINDHGKWIPYTKETTLSPEGFPLVPAGTIFCKRESDGIDWYDYSRAQYTWKKDSVKITVLPTGIGMVTQAVYTDFSVMFPQNCSVIEVLGFDGVKPHNEFGNKIYDPIEGTFTDIPKPSSTITFKRDIWLRATEAEADTIEAVLGQQSIRKQRIFSEAQHLDHLDPMFGELFAGFVQAFGQKRALELLAVS